MFKHSDADIEKDIREELKWEPSLRNDELAVSVRGGVVTLAGHVPSFYDRWKGERVSARVKGVKGVANDLEVRLPSSSERPDPELTRTIMNLLESDIWVPPNSIKVTVSEGWVTLEGEVDWFYQREEAERAFRRMTGVRGFSNMVHVKARPAPSDLKKKIKDALERGAQFDAERITIEVDGARVTLRGTVRSFAEKLDTERAARNAPGVTSVDNKLTVDPTIMAT